MSIIAKADATGEKKLPSAGLHNAVCCDVHDLGYEQTQWGDKRKILFVWELDEDHPDFDGPHRVNKKYTLSLHEKSTLSQDLESWRGKSFTPDERRTGFDLEKCIGTPAYVNVIHSETDSGVWANVKAVLPLPKGIEPIKISEGYVRMIDRKEEKAEENGAQDNFAAEEDLADLPF